MTTTLLISYALIVAWIISGLVLAAKTVPVTTSADR
jgi:hypothetical protein